MALDDLLAGDIKRAEAAERAAVVEQAGVAAASPSPATEAALARVTVRYRRYKRRRWTAYTFGALAAAIAASAAATDWWVLKAVAAGGSAFLGVVSYVGSRPTRPHRRDVTSPR